MCGASPRSPSPSPRTRSATGSSWSTRPGSAASIRTTPRRPPGRCAGWTWRSSSSPPTRRARLEQHVAAVRAAAANLFDVELVAPAPAGRLVDTHRFRYQFAPDPGQTEALAAAVRMHLPGGLGRHRVERYVREAAAQLLDRHVDGPGPTFSTGWPRPSAGCSPSWTDASTPAPVGSPTRYDARRRCTTSVSRPLPTPGWISSITATGPSGSPRNSRARPYGRVGSVLLRRAIRAPNPGR